MRDISFSKLTWENLPARTTALSATNLNRIEKGIDDSVNGVNSNSHSIAELQTRISQIANGSPTPVATVAEMTDESAVYLYTGSETGYTAGNWYYYDGASWTAGGTYGGAVTDTTLSTEGAAADAKAVGDALALKADADDVESLTEDIADVKEDLTSAIDGMPFDIVQMVGGIKRKTHNGITFTPSADGKSCTVNGTATNTAFLNIFANMASLPEGIVPGKFIRFNVTSTKPDQLRCAVLYYDASGEQIGSTLYISTTGRVEQLPDNLYGIIIRIHVSKNATMSNDVISCSIYPEVYDNPNFVEFSDKIEQLMTDSIINYYRYTGTDANNIGTNGWYFCDGTSVSNLPNNTHAFFVLTLQTDKSSLTRTQIAVDWAPGIVYYRRYVSGAWSAWVTNPLSIGTKYVAFGGSVWYGTIWTDEGKSRASTKHQIPTRVAKAIGMYDNFANEAVGGTGYLNPGSYTTITDKVLNYDFTGVEVATFAGGVNDKPLYQLGTASATAGDGTICGAIKSIIDHMAINFPRVQLIFVQPTPSGHLNDPWNGKLGGGWSINDFNREVGELCANEHVSYVPLTDSVYCKQWDLFSGGTGGGTSANYSHFKNSEDYAKFGDYVAGKISACFHGSN